MSGDVKLGLVVVIYNEQLINTKTYNSLVKQWSGPVLVYDNSTSHQQTDIPKQIEYFHDQSNSGVSTAYNYAKDWAQKLGCTHLLLADSDSQFAAEAQDTYTAEAKTENVGVFLPEVIANNRKISPFYFSYGKTHFGDSIGVTTPITKSIFGINSGMLISIEALTKIGGFEEQLPLDWSDIEFLRRAKSENISIKLIDLKMEHQLSELEERSVGAAKFRYTTYLKGIKFVAQNMFERILMLFWAKMRALKLCFHYRTPWFMIYYLKNWYV